jgi:hypothetical protein
LEYHPHMSGSAELYRNIYRTEGDAEAEWLRLTARPKIASVVALAARVPVPLHTVCEYGCGTGAVIEGALGALKADRWLAVDSSLEALQHLERRLTRNVAVSQADLQQDLSRLPECTLGIVSHVLEHLERPEHLLQALRSKSKYLIVEVPLLDNPLPRAIAALRARLQGIDRKNNPVGHIQFWTRRSFRRLVESSGWEVVADREYLPYFKEFLLAQAKRSGTSAARLLLPYYAYRALGPLATSLAVTHYALLLRPAT